MLLNVRTGLGTAWGMTDSFFDEEHIDKLSSHESVDPRRMFGKCGLQSMDEC